MLSTSSNRRRTSLAAVPEHFMNIVRQHSRTPDAVEFDPDASMASLGLGSLALVNLLVSIEEEYNIDFPQQLVRPAVFATPGRLWDHLESFLVQRNNNGEDS
jgi:acyl carrier protein